MEAPLNIVNHLRRKELGRRTGRKSPPMEQIPKQSWYQGRGGKKQAAILGKTLIFELQLFELKPLCQINLLGFLVAGLSRTDTGNAWWHHLVQNLRPIFREEDQLFLEVGEALARQVPEGGQRVHELPEVILHRHLSKEVASD